MGHLQNQVRVFLSVVLVFLTLGLSPVTLVESSSLYCNRNKNDCGNSYLHPGRKMHRQFRTTDQPKAAESYSLVIRNVTLLDGSGEDRRVTNVCVSGDKIVSIGAVNETLVDPLTEVIIVEADSHFLSPGFIDSHTHDDVAILQNRGHEFKKLQGVTTVITGNCGFSPFPNGDTNELVRQHLESLLGRIDIGHFSTDFASHRLKLESGMGVNTGSLVGHGPLRISVMGYEQRPASTEEIQRMCDLLSVQLDQGALGMSIGLVYPPSAYADEAELVALATVVAQRGKLLGGHIRSYEGSLLTSVGEFLNIVRKSGVKALLSHLQVAGKPYWNTIMDEALRMVKEAKEVEGLDIAVDMYPYLAGSSTILQLLPPSSQAGGFDSFLDKLEDVEFVEKLQNLTEGGKEPGWESKIALIGYENVVIGSVVNEELRGFEGKTLVEGAAALQAHEFDFLLYMVIEDNGQTNVILFQQSETDNNKVFQFQYQIVGSDSIPRQGGKPHPRGYGTFPRVIGRMTRQGTFTIEEAVRKTTYATAQTFNIKDKGLVREGYFADLVLFKKNITDTATFEEPTLVPEGIVGVWVNGVKVVDNGKAVNELPGVVVM